MFLEVSETVQAGLPEHEFHLGGYWYEIFTAETTGMDEDAKYLVNGNSVNEDEYYQQINGFVGGYDPLTRIAYDGLYEVSYRYEKGYGGFEQGEADKYSSADDIRKEIR